MRSAWAGQGGFPRVSGGFSPGFPQVDRAVHTRAPSAGKRVSIVTWTLVNVDRETQKNAPAICRLRGPGPGGNPEEHCGAPLAAPENDTTRDPDGSRAPQVRGDSSAQ